MRPASDVLRETGKRVRLARRAAEMTQAALATASDCDRTFIGGVERGERNVSLTTLVRIAQALGRDIRDLIPSSR